MPEDPRPPSPPGAMTLPARYYTDPDHFRAEFEHFFGSMWVCAGRNDQVPRRGDFFLRTLGDESIIVVRDGRGQVGAFFNVCRHRGTRLCTDPEGTFAETIQCPYHAWTYDLSGNLVGAPHMGCIPQFRKEDYPLHGLAVELWDGHIFIRVADAPGPLGDQLGELPEKFRPWGMGGLRRGARVVYDVAANWKLLIQNYSECLHCPLIHPALQGLSHYLSGQNEPPRPTYLGGWMTLREGVETLTMDGKRRRDYLPGLDAEGRGRIYYFAVLPNLLLSLHPDYMMTHTLWPRACDRTEVVCEWHFLPSEMARPGFDPGDAVEFWDLTNRQDWRACELSQLGIKSRAYSPGPYSDREDLLSGFDRIVVAASGPGGR